MTGDRAAILIGLRIGGAILCVLGIWMFLGGSIVGHYGFGGVLFVVGLIGLVGLPRLLEKRWKSRR